MKSHFKSLIKNDKYQVFLFTCPANFPFSFAVHPWFLVNNKGKMSRWEVSFSKYKRDLSFGHLNKDLFSSYQGIEIFPYIRRYTWRRIKLLGSAEGGDGSLAEQVVNFIEQSVQHYPFSQTYALRGPNSNTYAQWVLDAFPELNICLPWNAFGRTKVSYNITFR